MKKALSLFLTVVMILSTFSCLSVTTWAADSDLTAGQMYTIESDNYYTFIPEKSGSYLFRSFGYGDPYITIDCLNGYYEFDDNLGCDFYGVVDLEAGEEVSCFLYNNYDDEYIVFKITEYVEPVVTFVPVNPLEIMENTNGRWEEDECRIEETDEWVMVDYFHYEIPNQFLYTNGNKIILEYPDGTIEEYVYDDMDGYVNSLGNSITFSTRSNQGGSNPWKIGSDNYFIINVLGISVQVPVTIVENPCESFEFIPAEPFKIIENTNGYLENYTYWDEETGEEIGLDYFYYYVDGLFEKEGNTFVINYKDGTSEIYTCANGVYKNSNGEVLNAGYLSNQSYSNQWSVGSDNYFIAKAFGKEVQVPVTIIENPYESIEFIPVEPFKIVENTNGYWDIDWIWDEDSDEEFEVEYYRYNVRDLFYTDGNKIIVNYTDGTSDAYVYDDWYYKEDEDCYYSAFVNGAGEFLECEYYSYQWYSNRWLLGSDNYFTVEAFGKETQVPVTIVESPYESIEFIPVKPLEIVENTNGYWINEYYFDESLDEPIGEYVEYFCYRLPDNFRENGNRIIVNYSDGSSEAYVCDNWCYVNDKGEELEFDYSYYQSYENKWTVGSDNYFTISVFDKTVKVPVTITETPYASVEYIPAEDICIEQYTHGYWGESYTGDGFEETYTYDVEQCIGSKGDIIRLTKKDGSVEVYEYIDGYRIADKYGSTIEYLSFDAESEKWTVGDENYIKVTANGVTCNVPVTITEVSPIVAESSFVAEIISDNSCVIIEIIKDYDSDTVTIPETVDGYRVVGIEDGVLGGIYALRTLNLPATFNMISENLFYGCDRLEEINVSENNMVFASVNGVLYNKALTEIIYCPESFRGEFVIKAGVTDIPEQAYVGLNKARNVVIEQGNNSFTVEDGIIYNKDFTTIYRAFSVEGDYVMKSTVKTVADMAFSNLESLESVVFSNGVTEIAYATFVNCSALKSVDLPDALVSVEYCAFKNATALTSIAFPESTKSIGRYAFKACTSLKDVTLNEGLEKLGHGVFVECGIEEIELPSGLTAIPKYTFGYCPLKSIYIPEGVTKIDEYAFYNTDLTSVSIPSSVEIIDEAFNNCDKLVEVNFEEGFDGDCRCAFSGCEKLNNVNLPESVTKLSYNEFRGCSSLESIDIPDNLYKVEAFSLNTGSDFNSTGWYNEQPDGITYLEHVLYDYKGEMPIDFTATVKNGTKSIAEYAFERESELVDVKLNKGLKYIGKGAFVNCKNLNSVTIPESVEYIGEYAFGYNYSNYIGSYLRIPDFVICGSVGSAAEQYAKDCGFEFVEITEPEDVLCVETDGVLCGNEITYKLKLTEGTAVSGAVFGAMYDPDILEPVYEKSGAYLITDSYGDEIQNIPGMYVAGMKYGTDNVYLVAYVAMGDYVCSSDEDFVTFTFKVKDSSATSVAVDFYCLELSGTPAIAKNDCEVLIASCENEIASLEHVTGDDWQIEKDADAVQSGLKVRVCDICGEVLETEMIPQTVCDKPIIASVENTDDGIVLTWDEVYGADSYCLYRKSESDTGWVEIAELTAASYIDEDVLNNVEYSYMLVACNEAGESEYSESVSKLYHRHSMSDWFIRTAATCTEYGEGYRVCDGCEYEEVRAIEPSGHNYSEEWTVDLAPTCTADGVKSHHCTACGDKVDITTIVATGHNYECIGVLDEHPHTKTDKCTFCGDEITENNVISNCIECNFTVTVVGEYKLISYIGEQSRVIIPSQYKGKYVTTIANACFRDNTTITYVEIPNSVKSIGALAFMNCSSLEKVIIPESVTSIGAQAFYGFNGTIYCVSGSAAHEYAVANNIKFVLMGITGTENTTIDYDNYIIRTSVQNCDDINGILGVSETAIAVPIASYIYGDIELYGTGTIVTVFDGNEYIGDFTLVVDGDTNGDSVCDALDCAQVELAANNNSSFAGAYAMAADGNADDVIDFNDYQSIVNKALAS